MEDITSLNIPKEVSGLELRERSGLDCEVVSHLCTGGGPLDQTERRRGPNTEPGKEPEKEPWEEGGSVSGMGGSRAPGCSKHHCICRAPGKQAGSLAPPRGCTSESKCQPGPQALRKCSVF